MAILFFHKSVVYYYYSNHVWLLLAGDCKWRLSGGARVRSDDPEYRGQRAAGGHRRPRRPHRRGSVPLPLSSLLPPPTPPTPTLASLPSLHSTAYHFIFFHFLLTLFFHSFSLVSGYITHIYIIQCILICILIKLI